MKDYYLILGVLPDAEDIVIKAAYKALVQRYHPDRYKGNAQEAQRKTAELNEAYEILSNPQKRADYDRTRKASQGSTSDYDDTDTSDSYGVNDLDQDWAVVVEYYPNLTRLEERLRKISMPLSIGFKQAMLETKDFDHRQQIAKILEQRFLEVYFGSHPKVIEFALKLILDGKKEGAKELNRTINVVGSKADPTPVIEKLHAKHYAEEILAEERRKQAERERREAERKEEIERKEAERLKKEDYENSKGIFVFLGWFVVSTAGFFIFPEPEYKWLVVALGVIPWGLLAMGIIAILAGVIIAIIGLLIDKIKGVRPK